MKNHKKTAIAIAAVLAVSIGIGCTVLVHQQKNPPVMIPEETKNSETADITVTVAETTLDIETTAALKTETTTAPETTAAPEITAAPVTTAAPETTAAPTPETEAPKAEQDKQNQQQQEQQQQQAQQEQIVYKYLLSDVKMRVSPDINSDHYGILPAGTQLTFKKVTDVKYKDGYWVLVTYKHQLNPNLEIYVADSWISDDPNAYINYNQAQEVKPQPSVQQQGQQIEDTNKNPSQQGQTGTQQGQQGQQGGQQQAQAPSFMPQGSAVFTGNYYNEMVAKYGEAGAQDLVSRAQKVYYDIAALPQAEQTKLLEDVKNIDTTLAYTRADGSKYDTNRVKEWLKVVTLPNGENVLNYGERGKVLWVDPNGRGSISYNTNSGCIGTNFINNDGTTSRWDDACYGSQDIKDVLDAGGGRVGSTENTNY